MKKGKYAKRTPFVKTLAVAMVLVTLIGCAIGGTLAWLTDKTEQVVNTFTVSDIDIKLEETTGNEYKMIPGWTITKDPVATVLANSEDCYLFVRVEKSENYDEYMTHEIADGWTELKTVATDTVQVYYRVFDSKDSSNTNEMGTEYPVLKDNKVNVLATVTEKMMEAVMDDPTTKLDETKYPTLTFTAYATQLYKNNTERFGADDAWKIAFAK